MSKINRFLQSIYTDFSGGLNDSIAAISIGDNESVLSENADYSAEIKSYRTRQGIENVNQDPVGHVIRQTQNITVSFTDPHTLTEERYEFVRKNGAWYLGETAVSLSSYGLSVSGEGLTINGDTIVLIPSTATATFYFAPLDITDVHIWHVGSKYKKCVVFDGAVFEYDEANDTFIQKVSLWGRAGNDPKKKIYPFVVFNKFYFGDGHDLYCWGDHDYSTDSGSSPVTVNVGQIVQNNLNSGGSSGHFYQAKTQRSSINLTTENYRDTSNWTDVTEVPYVASSVMRKVTPYNPSQSESVDITVVSGSIEAGTITLYLDDTPHTASVSAGASIDTVVNAIKAMSITGWTSVKVGNTVTFTKNTVGLVTNGYIDAGETGCILTYTTAREGKINDNNLSPIEKCTMFVVHTASYRVFATGNPDDNAVYYSEIGNPTYFKSDYNKVYPENRYGKPTGLVQLSESVLVSFENGWYVWNGINVLEDAKWKPMNLPYGCVSNRTIALTPYSFIFLGRDGLYNVSASILNSDIVLLQGKDVISRITGSRVDKAISSIKDRTLCEGFFRDNTYYLAYNVEGSDGNTLVLKYEWETKSFTINTGWKANAWCEDGDGFYFASANYLMKVGVGFNDIDVVTGELKPIHFHIKTKEYHFGNATVNKVVRLVGVIFKQTVGVQEIDADCRVIMGYNDHIFEYELQTMDTTESLIWGRTWGKIWGYREAIVKMIELTQLSNTFQIEIQNNKLNSPLTVIAIGFVYEPTDFVIPTILKDEVLLE